MPRVHLVTPDEAPLTVRSHFAGGQPGPIPSSLAHVPELMQVALPFIGRALGPSGIDLRTKELVILRASALHLCRYCVGTHTAVALGAGLSRAEVEALRDVDGGLEVFADPRERALLAWTDLVALGPAPVPPTAMEAFRAYFDEAEVVELTLLVGATVMLNRYATALELPISAAHDELLRQHGFDA